LSSSVILLLFSALTAGPIATSALVSTIIGAFSSGFVWLCLSSYRGKPATTSILNGILSGLAGITPASGYIDSPASILLGLILGFASYFAAYLLKHRFAIDDALEVSAVHGLTGMIGSLFIGLFSRLDINPEGANGLFYGNPMQLLAQFFGVAVCASWSALWTFVILLVLQRCLGTIRLSASAEFVGGDWSEHGEVAYHDLLVLELHERLDEKHAMFPPSHREQSQETVDKERQRLASSLHSALIPSLLPPVNRPASINSHAINGRSGAMIPIRLSKAASLLALLEHELPSNDGYRRQDIN